LVSFGSEEGRAAAPDEHNTTVVCRWLAVALLHPLERIGFLNSMAGRDRLGFVGMHGGRLLAGTGDDKQWHCRSKGKAANQQRHADGNQRCATDFE
jgi:hypothetical protein